MDDTLQEPAIKQILIKITINNLPFMFIIY